MRLKDGDCHKMAIRTRFGSFEWRILCFRLTDALAALSRLLGRLFRNLLGGCIVLYPDHILVYSKSIEEHIEHLRRLFDLLRK